MNRHSMGRAPDYTTAALVTLAVNLFCLLVALRLAVGWPVVILTALALNHLIDRLALRRGRR